MSSSSQNTTPYDSEDSSDDSSDYSTDSDEEITAVSKPAKQRLVVSKSAIEERKSKRGSRSSLTLSPEDLDFIDEDFETEEQKLFEGMIDKTIDEKTGSEQKGPVLHQVERRLLLSFLLQPSLLLL